MRRFLLPSENHENVQYALRPMAGALLSSCTPSCATDFAMAAFALDRTPVEFAQINVTPLVDVMLVLLVIFMITTPLLTHKLTLDFSHCTQDCPNPSDPVKLSVKQTGELYWNGVALNRAELANNLAILARQDDPPMLTLRAEARTKYERITEVLAMAKNANLHRISVESVAR
jgi:biopolymer transport protein ExbD